MKRLIAICCVSVMLSGCAAAGGGGTSAIPLREAADAHMTGHAYYTILRFTGLQPSALNNLGELAGTYIVSPATWRNFKLTRLNDGVGPCRGDAAIGLNDNGVVVGADACGAIRYDAAGPTVLLPRSIRRRYQ